MNSWNMSMYVCVCVIRSGHVRRYMLYCVRSPVVCVGLPVMWSCVIRCAFLLCKSD